MSEKQLFEVFSPKSGEVMAVPTILKMAISKSCALFCLKIFFKTVRRISQLRKPLIFLMDALPQTI